VQPEANAGAPLEQLGRGASESSSKCKLRLLSKAHRFGYALRHFVFARIAGATHMQIRKGIKVPNYGKQNCYRLVSQCGDFPARRYPVQRPHKMNRLPATLALGCARKRSLALACPWPSIRERQ
jgi:hypothetical protein